MWSWGKGTYGQLGQGTIKAHQSTRFSASVTPTGLDGEPLWNRALPALVSMPFTIESESDSGLAGDSSIVSVAAGAEHSLFLDDTSNVYR